MKSAKSVPPEVVQQVAEYFSILSEPMRLRLLNLLGDGEKCVQELVEATRTSKRECFKAPEDHVAGRNPQPAQ